MIMSMNLVRPLHCKFTRVASCQRHLTVASAAAAAAATPRVRYSKAHDKSNLFYYTVPPPEGVDSITNVEADERSVQLTDLRTAPTTLRSSGFELVDLPLGEKVNWEDDQQVKSVYYPEVEKLLKQKMGASRVIVVQHALRRGKITKRPIGELRIPGKEEPALLIHNDYTDESGPLTMQYFAGDEAAELSKKSWALVNVWRPLTGPVQDSPLGLIDAATTAPDDVFPVTIHLAGGATHDVTYFSHNPNHRWYWTSQMQEHEAYVFVQHDSRTDGRPRAVGHAAIADPSIPEDAPKRQSVETRAVVFFDD